MHPKLEEATALLRKRLPNVLAVYQFGSFGTPFEKTSSDVDLAFLNPVNLSSVELWNLEQELSVLLQKDVDLIDLRSQPTVMRMQVISTGDRIWCGDFNASEVFEDFVFSDYANLSERRQDIINDVRKRGSVYG